MKSNDASGDLNDTSWRKVEWLQRVARKINPLTECVTDDECAVEIETSAAFFVEPEGGDDKQSEV